MTLTVNEILKLDEDTVRMRIVMELVLGDHNSKKDAVEASAEGFWQKIRYPSTV